MSDQLPGPAQGVTSPVHGECQFLLSKAAAPRLCNKPGSAKLVFPCDTPSLDVWQLEDGLGARFACFQHIDREIARLEAKGLKVTPSVWKSCPACNGTRLLNGAACQPCRGTGETRAKVPLATEEPVGDDYYDDD